MRVGVAALAVAFLAIPGVEAKTAKQTHNKNANNLHKVDKAGAGTVTNSVTTGFREIKGWHEGLVQRDPNLPHWEWLAMQEMNKNYIHLKPGQISANGVRPGQRRYIRPVHITPSERSSVHPPVPIATRDTGTHYVRPVHVPTTLDTSARVSLPVVHVSLAAPKTNAQLAVPNTSIKLSAPKTDVRLAAPTTAVRLAAPRTNVQLASTQTHIQLAAPQTSVQLAAPTTAVSLREPRTEARLADSNEFGHGDSDDSDNFAAPDAYAHNAYGIARHSGTGCSSTSQVKAKLVRHK